MTPFEYEERIAELEKKNETLGKFIEHYKLQTYLNNLGYMAYRKFTDAALEKYQLLGYLLLSAFEELEKDLNYTNRQYEEHEDSIKSVENLLDDMGA